MSIGTGSEGMNKVAVIALVLLGLVSLSGAAQAEIFKWVDADGKVHFSDRKISSEAQKINVKTGTESSSKNQASKNQDSTADNNAVNNATTTEDDQSVEQRLLQQKKYVNFLASERIERKEKRQQAKQEKDKKIKLCNAMQDQLNGYTQGNYRWYELNEETGERTFLEDDKIEAKKQQLQSDIKSNCS